MNKFAVLFHVSYTDIFVPLPFIGPYITREGQGESNYKEKFSWSKVTRNQNSISLVSVGYLRVVEIQRKREERDNPDRINQKRTNGFAPTGNSIRNVKWSRTDNTEHAVETIK